MMIMCYSENVDEYIVSEEPLVKVKILDLDWEYHADASLSDIVSEHVCH